MNKSGGQTAHALAFGSVTLRPGGKFKDPVLVGVTQPRSFRSLFFVFFSLNLSPCLCFLPFFSLLSAIAPSSPHVSHFLPSPSLFVQTRYYNSLLALAKPAESDGGKKKPINISCRTSLSPLSSLRRYLNATRGRFFHSTWLLSPLPPSPFPTMDLRRSCLFTFSF